MTQTSHGHFLDSMQLPPGTTRFWLIRHALVDAAARQRLYGAMDVDLCAESLALQRPYYEAIARRLPQDAAWFVSPLTRTLETARAIFAAGYGERPVLVEPRMIEQHMGEWHDLPHQELPARLRQRPHGFWSTSATERPPGGESMLDVCARVSHALDDMAEERPGQDSIIVSHGGAIRAALAHALHIHPDTALRFSIQNLSLTILERIDGLWRVVTVNELPSAVTPSATR
ncbi:histidine phosphatase family protein [Acidomonas methanolica]|uniref:Phosphoglycerate/bisphosphoglycerate mutase n=1 Tax=Acidomonas methanolica NBRC 104435 TaxID=1231351 RepID=A0A023D7S0_ACIMT|nr:histidine phosphatase family protein [Acidomonas methanolica]MBU2655273.1 histidine phosphatase family protein [Acidomonas methanolica]TCS24060.1 broad specificity phosphatase PhoE [Acidomonas methanolica]GAJ29785.1 phosphoglycerate/bisphosphoglycerate mutase [Acidomonas methanolica NBRC 104435]GBQ51687.1 phosphoglycerate mutase [Acidomonas methanolica]GEL00115.1 alpha-ribazole-5'-phosphate phosphatase [Acidomonas methanolica NBRC 104435]